MNIQFLYYPGGKTKALTMSYDDGQIHDRRLVELFNQYGIKGTFHLNSARFSMEDIIDATEVRTLYRGHEISCHTRTHPYPTQINNDLMLEEILEDRRALEALAGYPVRGMSYPFGDYDESVKAICRAAGMEYSRTCNNHGNFRLPTDFMEWGATCHHNDKLMERLRQFQHDLPWNSRMPLLYVWGHSFEFHRQNNWELIVEFCKRASDDPEVWYATNIEIVDYVNALRSLRFTFDRKAVFNPSGQPVWIAVDGEPCEIRPMETRAL